MLQLELNRLTEETNRMNARIEMDNCMQELPFISGHSGREGDSCTCQFPDTEFQY